MKTSTTKKRNLLFAVFCIEKIFSRGLYLTLCSEVCLLHTGVGRGFCCKLFASGNGQARRINNTLRRTYDKNHYCKIVFACFAKRQNCIFPEFVFDFLHCNLPFCTQGLAEVFLLQIVCLGKGQARHLNNTLHRPSDKNHYCKNCFCMLCTSDKIAFFRFDGQACVKPQRRQRNLKRLHGKRFACKRQRNFCASKNCTPNCLSDKYAFFFV